MSVIVPAYQAEDALAGCLESLRAQSIPRDELQTIVVDNGSAPPLSERLHRRFGNVLWLHEERPGSYAARNRGLTAASGTFVAFTDSDCRPDATWLAKALERLTSQSTKTILGGAVRLSVHDRHRATAAELYELAYAFRQQRYVEVDGFAATANLVTRRDAFGEVGLFDASRRSGGDRDWCERARSHGYEVVYEPNAVVEHPARASLQELQIKARRLAGGMHQRAIARSTPLLSQVRQAVTLCVPTPAVMSIALQSEQLHGLRERSVALAVAQVVRWHQAAELVNLACGGTLVR